MIIRKCSKCGRQIIDYGVTVVGETNNYDFKFCPFCGNEITLEGIPSNEASFVVNKEGVLMSSFFLDGATVKLPDNIKAIGPFAFKPIGNNESIDNWKQKTKHIGHLILNKSLEKISPVAFIPVVIDSLDVDSLESLLAIKGEFLLPNKTREKNVWNYIDYDYDREKWHDYSLLSFFSWNIFLIKGKIVSNLSITKQIVNSFDWYTSPTIKSKHLKVIRIEKNISLPKDLISFCFTDEIIFDGTKEEWKLIAQPFYNVPLEFNIVHCSDGDIKNN